MEVLVKHPSGNQMKACDECKYRTLNCNGPHRKINIMTCPANNGEYYEPDNIKQNPKEVNNDYTYLIKILKKYNIK